MRPGSFHDGAIASRVFPRSRRCPGTSHTASRTRTQHTRMQTPPHTQKGLRHPYRRPSYNPDAYRKGPLLASKNSSGKRCVRRSEQAIQGRLGQRRARVSPVSHVRTAAPWIENKRAIDTRWRGRHVRRTRRMKPMPYRRDGGERGIAADLRANASARPLSRETRTRRRSHRSESVDGTIVAPRGVFEKV